MNEINLGVLIVGHGTRDAIGQMQMRNLACQAAGCIATYANAPPLGNGVSLPTELGFLELAEPSIADGVRSLAAMGVKQLLVVPVLLFRAGHADRDIPEAVQAAAEPLGIEVVGQTPPLEYQPAVLDLSAQRFFEAIGSSTESSAASQFSPADVNLALIARGSSSDSAAAAMERFAQLRCERTPVRSYRVGYVAVRKPNVVDSLDWLESSDAQVLVVQPHLLFEGEVFHSLCSAVDERRVRDGRQWFVCKPLGATVEHFEDVRLAKVLAQLVLPWI